MRGAEFGDGEGNGGEKLRVDTDEIRGETDVEKRRVGGELARVLLFVTMPGEKVGAVGWAVEGDLALGAAADGADSFGFGRAEAAWFTFLTDRTRHEVSLERVDSLAGYAVLEEKTKARSSMPDRP